MLDRALFWLGLAATAPQGLWVERTAPRFPGAPGARIGAFEGAGGPFRLLGLGDSIIDGVGADDISRSMAVTAARRIAALTGRKVEFEIVGRLGATSSSIRRDLLPQVTGTGFDFVVISAGVNDVTGRTRTSSWRSEMQALIADIAGHSPAAHVLTCGLPPLGRFPLLPPPLRSFIGIRASTLDRILSEVAAQHEQVTWLPTDFDAAPEKFAADGYHPNTESHQEWGRRVGEALLAKI